LIKQFVITNIDALIQLVIGIGVLYTLGFRKLTPDEPGSLAKQSGRRRIGKVVGLGLIALATISIARNASAPIPWETVSQPGLFSIDLPQPVQFKKSTEQSFAGPVEMSKWSVSDRRGVYYLVSVWEYADGTTLPATEVILQNWNATVLAQGYTVTSSAQVMQNGYRGTSAHLNAPKSCVQEMELVNTTRRRYQLIVTYPAGVTAERDRFFTSFKIESGQ